MTLQRLATEERWELVMLFGSRARGCARPDSDYDVAVMAGQGSRAAEGLPAALGSGNLDVVWLDDASWVLTAEVARDGVVLFENVPHAAEEMRAVAQRRSWDADTWRWRTRAFIRRKLEQSMALNRDLVERKLAALLQYVDELEPILALPPERFLTDPMVHHAAERLVELLVEHSAAINTEVAAAVSSAPPSDYYSSFFSLAGTGWITQELALELGQWARIRNSLVHRYETVALPDLQRQLTGSSRLWREYAAAISQRLS